MDVNSSLEEKSTNKTLGHRDRGPSFSQKEVRALMVLVMKYKSIILNKHTDSNTNHAKEKVWAKIAKLFNKQNIKLYRSPDTLKTKWENLKRESRRVQKNLIDENDIPLDEINNQVLSLLCEGDNISEKLDLEIIDQELNDSDDEDNEGFKSWNGEKASGHSDSDDDVEKRLRAFNFTPQESNLLLKLVRDEKRIIFMAGSTKKIIHMKRLAWERITQSFNQVNPQKRSLQVLRTKFLNMKRRNEQLKKIRANSTQSAKQNGEENVIVNVKEEPSIEFMHHMDSEQDVEESHLSERHSSPLHNDDSVDPLRFVLNADSGIGSTGNMVPWSETENKKEIVKLKMELLNYKLETAKLERKRLEDAIKTDKLDRESRAIENSLRLRTARLEAIAAECKLSHHPALAYTEKELLALEYMKSTNTDNNT